MPLPISVAGEASVPRGVAGVEACSQPTLVERFAMTEDEKSKETRNIMLGLIGLALAALLFIAFAVVIGERIG